MSYKHVKKHLQLCRQILVHIINGAPRSKRTQRKKHQHATIAGKQDEMKQVILASLESSNINDDRQLVQTKLKPVFIKLL